MLKNLKISEELHKLLKIQAVMRGENIQQATERIIRAGLAAGIADQKAQENKKQDERRED